MRFLVTIVFLSVILFPSFAKPIDGVVIDATTKERLSFVHIGILNQNRGVISTDEGKFHIELPESMDNEELVFSMIGYEVKKYAIKEIKESFLEVKMVPKTYELGEVIVKAKREKVKPIKLGRYKTAMTTIGHSGTREFGLGGEWGLKIAIDQKRFEVKNIQFHVRFNTLDSILFRINIYKIKDGLPDESILKKELFVKSHKNQNWIVKDVSKDPIYLTEDVIVTFEVVQLWWDKDGDNQLFFTYGSGYSEGGSYSRESSQDKWKTDGRPPVALFLTAVEY